MYDPASGRFTTRDSWQGDYNRPLSLNRWMYVEGNPVNRRDPSGKCWYWNASAGKVERNPFEGGPSEPCEFFADIMESNGINVSTPENWLNNIPQELRGELSCGNGDVDLPDELFWESSTPQFGTPANFGNYVGGISMPPVVGLYQQFGLHGEYEDTLGVGTFMLVSASVRYRLRYDVEKFQSATVLTLHESYEIRPPEWVDAEGTVSLDMFTNSGFHTLNLGDIEYDKRIQTRKTPIVFYGAGENPNWLAVKFFTWMSETLMGNSVNNYVELPRP